jgi:hypothetical protein
VPQSTLHWRLDGRTPTAVAITARSYTPNLVASGRPEAYLRNLLSILKGNYLRGAAGVPYGYRPRS